MTHPDEMNDYVRPPGVLPSDLLRTDTVFESSTPGADARLHVVAVARDAAHAAWRDSYGLRDVTVGQWSAPAVTGLLQDEDDVQDTTALRVLANRVAAASARSSRMHDPQTALVNLARSAGAMAAAASDIMLGKISVTLSDDDTINDLAQVVRGLVAAADTLELLARRTF